VLDCAANCTASATVCDSVSIEAAMITAHGVLAHLCVHLVKAENPLTKIDICKTLQVVLRHWPHKWQQCVDCRLLSGLVTLIKQDTYEVRIEAGNLCLSFLHCLVGFNRFSF
jgi:hypothetical protein